MADEPNLKKNLENKLASAGRVVKPEELKKEVQVLKRSDVLQIISGMIQQFGQMQNKDILAKMVEMEMLQQQGKGRSEAVAAELAALKEQHAKLVQENADQGQALAKNEAARQAAEMVAAELAALKGQHAKLAQEKAEREQALAKSEASRQAAEAEVAALRPVREERDRLKAELAQMAARVAEAERLLAESKSAGDQARGAAGAQAEELARTVQRAVAAESERDQLQLQGARLEAEVESLKRKAEELIRTQEKLAVVEKERDESRAEAARLRDEVAVLRPKAEELVLTSERLATTEKERDGIKLEADRLRVEVEGLRIKAQTLVTTTAMLAQATQERDQARGEIDRYRSEAEQAKADLKKTTAEYKENMDRMSKQLEEARVKAAKFDAAERDLKAKTEAFQKEIERIRKEYEERIERLNEEIRTLEVALDRFVLVPAIDFGAPAAPELRQRLQGNQARLAELVKSMEAGNGSFNLICEISEVLAESRTLLGLSQQN